MSTEQILSSDGIPLEESLKKAERKNKLKAVLLVAPLFLFILIIYVYFQLETCFLEVLMIV